MGCQLLSQSVGLQYSEKQSLQLQIRLDTEHRSHKATRLFGGSWNISWELSSRTTFSLDHKSIQFQILLTFQQYTAFQFYSFPTSRTKSQILRDQDCLGVSCPLPLVWGNVMFFEPSLDNIKIYYHYHRRNLRGTPRFGLGTRTPTF